MVIIVNYIFQHWWIQIIETIITIDAYNHFKSLFFYNYCQLQLLLTIIIIILFIKYKYKFCLWNILLSINVTFIHES